MSELKPCPFCGCKVSFVRDCHGWNKVIGEHSNKCPLDGNNLLTWSSEENAPILDKWNTREDCWISVDDELPKAWETVYIYPRPDFGIDCHVGEVNKKGVWTSESYSTWGVERVKVSVTHWMPLPPPPTK